MPLQYTIRGATFTYDSFYKQVILKSILIFVLFDLRKERRQGFLSAAAMF